VWSDGTFGTHGGEISLTYSMRSEIPRYRKVDRSKFTFPVNRQNGKLTFISVEPAG